MHVLLVKRINLEELLRVDGPVERYRVFVGGLGVVSLGFVSRKLVQVISEVIRFLRIYLIFRHSLFHFFFVWFLCTLLFTWQEALIYHDIHKVIFQLNLNLDQFC